MVLIILYNLHEGQKMDFKELLTYTDRRFKYGSALVFGVDFSKDIKLYLTFAPF